MAWRRGQAYSDDLRGRVLATKGSARVVAARFEVSVSYVLRARQRRDRHGELHARPQVSRTPRRLAELHDAIAAQIRARDDATLDELRAWLHETHGVAASIGLMWNTVARLGLTLKKVAPGGGTGTCGRRCRTNRLAGAAARPEPRAPGVSG